MVVKSINDRMNRKDFIGLVLNKKWDRNLVQKREIWKRDQWKCVNYCLIDSLILIKVDIIKLVFYKQPSREAIRRITNNN